MTEQIPYIASGPRGSYEAFIDTLANYLANAPVLTAGGQQPDTTIVTWIAYSDIGLGPIENLPVGLIAPLNDNVLPYGKGGGTGGRFGTDLDEFTVPILIVQAEHLYEPPVATTAPAPAANYKQSPGGRELVELLQKIRKALRADPTFGMSVATSTITELRPMLIDLDNKVYRGARLTLAARTRRSRA